MPRSMPRRAACRRRASKPAQSASFMARSRLSAKRPVEDESANANLIVWPSVFERNRRTILSASMMGCRGKVQHESGVIHLIVEHVSDLSSELKRISGLDAAFPLVPGRGDEARHGSHGPDRRDPRPITRPRDMYEPDLHIDTLKLKARNFR